MKDAFLDMLAIAPVAPRATAPAPQPQLRRPVLPPPHQAPRPPVAVVGPLYRPAEGARPSFADDIDRMVAELVRAGDVVWDQEADAYRAPYCRRFKFSG